MGTWPCSNPKPTKEGSPVITSYIHVPTFWSLLCRGRNMTTNVMVPGSYPPIYLSIYVLYISTMSFTYMYIQLYTYVCRWLKLATASHASSCTSRLYWYTSFGLYASSFLSPPGQERTHSNWSLFGNFSPFQWS